MQYFLLFVLLLGCTKVHDLKDKNGILYLEDVESEMTQVKHVEWEVGLKKEITISRGIRISTSVPVISESAKKTMFRKHGVDSWLFRFNRTRRGRTDQLGHVYYHFDNISRSTKTFTLNIYYHASAVSKQFYHFHCPAFDHRSYLPDIELEDSSADAEGVFVRAMSKVPARVHRLGFNPMVLSAGRSMLGEYTVEFALYNSESKQLFSKWHQVAGKIPLNQEITRTVSSCAGVKEEENPLPQSKPFDIRNIEIR
ncbi:MAG: hypothetical protein CME62_08245 [Halobacteriovoraceae bacterium]|nr:hypothetical protein [Halobacteriovoraceae bacterium]|tara:strand:- start:20659 stop:21420 length:762 start_codon:yes stop_codon:yes gene_type:complete